MNPRGFRPAQPVRADLSGWLEQLCAQSPIEAAQGVVAASHGLESVVPLRDAITTDEIAVQAPGLRAVGSSLLQVFHQRPAHPGGLR